VKPIRQACFTKLGEFGPSAVIKFKLHQMFLASRSGYCGTSGVFRSK